MAVAERMDWMLEQVENNLGENSSNVSKIIDHVELNGTDGLSISSCNSLQEEAVIQHSESSEVNEECDDGESDNLSASVDMSSEDEEEINIRELDSRATYVVDADVTSLVPTDETCEQWVDDILFGELEVVGREMVSRATYIIEPDDSTFFEPVFEEKPETPIEDMINEILENTQNLMKEEKTKEKNSKTTNSCSKEDPEDIDKFIQDFLSESTPV
uniref:uncharacterized protein LOC120346422 n=1 Tax=Styela clava TaxID=7725 RepID=UPI001939C931|nr:uncharacterized protein LOC120346422 [Styela clava]